MSDSRTNRRHRPATAMVAIDKPRSIRDNMRPQDEPEVRPNGGRVLTSLALCLLLAGSLAGLGFAFQSDTFRIAHLQIDGASGAIQQQIEDAVVPGCLETSAGFADCLPDMFGPNELTFNTRELQQQLERLPAIKTAHVKASLPNRLTIQITQRQPEIAWLVGSDTYRVAGDGMVIDRGLVDGLRIRIGQVGGDPVKPGDQVDMSVIKGAELLQDHLATDFGITPRRIQYSPSDGLAVIGDQDMIAMFGQPQELNLKMAELQRIVELAKGQKRTLAFVDLRYKTPFFRTN